MKMIYVPKIQANLKSYQTVKTNRMTTQILDGSYKSMFKGRSMNFDELREYVQGDDVKDMDWKASARSQKLLVRQYIAERKHNIMLIMDTNKRMLGDSDGLEEKRELAIMSAGTLAYLVDKNGDYVSATFSNGKSISHFPFKTGLGNIELILQNYNKAVNLDNESNLNASLEYVIKNFRRRMIILVVTDVAGILDVSEANLKRLLVAHDVLFLNISDVKVGGKNVFGLDAQKYMPEYLTRNKRFVKHLSEERERSLKMATDKLKNLGIANSTVDYLDELDREIVNLLESHKFEKR